MSKTTTVEKFWMRNNDGGIVAGNLEFDSMEEARKAARAWNRGEKRPHLIVAIVANAAVTAHATKVSAIQ